MTRWSDSLAKLGHLVAIRVFVCRGFKLQFSTRVLTDPNIWSVDTSRAEIRILSTVLL